MYMAMNSTSQWKLLNLKYFYIFVLQQACVFL